MTKEIKDKDVARIVFFDNVKKIVVKADDAHGIISAYRKAILATEHAVEGAVDQTSGFFIDKSEKSLLEARAAAEKAKDLAEEIYRQAVAAAEAVENAIDYFNNEKK
jgi:hypothetical protein